MALNPVVEKVTARIKERSRDRRGAYEARMIAARQDKPARSHMSCSNLAHTFAASGDDKEALRQFSFPNIGIVTAYNDMLSAHQPFEHYPEIIKSAARKAGATAQVAGGVPAMCDGVTQGEPGMELSLFSRDVIALAASVALSHNAFDAALMLGVCDKIVPGLFIGAAAFGHLPTVFVPAGPMPSGIANGKKAEVRQRYAEGKATRDELLVVEAASYHSPGTCTFYGTANSNQMVMEAMGLHVPGTAFVHPGTPLRKALTEAATKLAAKSTAIGSDYRPFWKIADAHAFVNGIVMLLATGGSTNHTIHMLAMALAVGLEIDWTDFEELSMVTPLIARVYPNGSADINHFQAAGGHAFVTRELVRAGLMHDDVETVWGQGLADYQREPQLRDGELVWIDPPEASLDRDILRPVDDPFSADGGLKLVEGNIGRAIVKVSAVKPDNRAIVAPARIFHSQAELEEAFRAGKLNESFVAVLPLQGARAMGMPELHKLTPVLGALMDRGHQVALLTDGRMSGASGKVLAAIHTSPEALAGGAIGRIRDGDMIEIDADRSVLNVRVEPAELMTRALPEHADPSTQHGSGRELFQLFRNHVSPADKGGSAIL